MSAIALSLRAPLEARLEVEGLAPDRLAALSASAIERLPVWFGGRQAHLGDVFHVRGGGEARVRVEGLLSRVDGIGAGMAGGELLVIGDAGARVGAGMSGGRLDVEGSVSDDAGLAMSGGVLRVAGDAGDRLGAATPGASKGMSGGEIVVAGAAGADAAARARRGLVVVCGPVGDQAGRAMIAGSLIAFGHVNGTPGRGSKRGSIVALGGVDVPDTYRYACTYEPPHVRLTLTYLRRRYGLHIEERAIAGAYRRYCGDAGEPGKGEILAWTGA